MRSKFEVSGQYLTHTGVDPFTGGSFARTYWLPVGTDARPGGYVRLDTSRDGRFPGTLGSQPHTNGVTWTAADMVDLLEQVKRDWHRERRAAKFG